MARFGLWRDELRSNVGARLRGLGQITDDQLDQVNAKLTDLTDRVAHQYAIIYEAQRVGFGRDVVGEAMRSYERITTQLQALASTPPHSGAELEEWLARATGVESQVGELEEQVRTQLPAGSAARTRKIVLTTGALLAGAGALAVGVWYYSRSRRWYRYVYGRSRK